VNDNKETGEENDRTRPSAKEKLVLSLYETNALGTHPDFEWSELP